jgi:hypothetical protein
VATLRDIKEKVRRLTKSPSASQLTDIQLEKYINNFILYDIPRSINLFTFRETLTFYLMPYVDTYRTNTTDVGNPLYDFKNRYVTVHPPVYVAGQKAFFTQSREDFYNKVNRVKSISTVGSGDGVMNIFNGVLPNIPVESGSVMFSAIDANNNGMVIHDKADAGIVSHLYDSNTNAISGNINHVTGEYDLVFTSAPSQSSDITAEVIPYVSGLPTKVLYFDNMFKVSPVPDKSYSLNIEVYKVPSAMDDDADLPELDQMWQYIAFGASKKVFEDRMDSDSLNFIIPLLLEQERFVLRRTLVQQSNERVSTIYQGNDNNGNDGFFRGGFY